MGARDGVFGESHRHPLGPRGELMNGKSDEVERTLPSCKSSRSFDLIVEGEALRIGSDESNTMNGIEVFGRGGAG